jgi:hypothetical protein
VTIETKPERPVIDLTGPDGNAFVLIGTATRICKQLGYEKQEQEKVVAEMMSGDYKNLVEVFEKNFGDYITLLVPKEW